MLKFEKVNNDDNSVSYLYFPEGREPSGKITINKNDGTVVEQIVAKSDEFKRYFFHMYEKIEEFIENNQFEEKGTIMWY